MALPEPRAEVDTRLARIDHAIKAPGQAGMTEAFGDLLFALARWATSLDVEPEQALRDAARRFSDRVEWQQPAPSEDG